MISRAWLLALALVTVCAGCAPTQVVPVVPDDDPVTEPERDPEPAIVDSLADQVERLERVCADLTIQRDALVKELAELGSRSVIVESDPPAPAVSESAPLYQQDLAYQIVATAPAFTGSDVGESSETSNATRALRAILIRDNARAMIDDLLRDATYAGQLYALCALYYLDRQAYEGAYKRISTVKEEVEFAFLGMYLQTRPVSDVIKHVNDPDFRSGVVESDYWLPVLDLDNEFDLDRYRKRLGEVRMRFPALERRLKFSVPEDDLDACEGLVALAVVDPSWAMPRILRHVGSRQRVVRRQAGSLLATLAPWASLVIDDLLDLYRMGNDEEVGEITNVLLEERLWQFTPLDKIVRFLDPDFVADSQSAVVSAGYEDVCELVIEAILDRPDLHESGVDFLLRILSSSDGEHAEDVVANLLVRGDIGVERLAAAHEAATPEQALIIVEALAEPSIRPWLPAPLDALVPRSE